jgi:hypothetical protein
MPAIRTAVVYKAPADTVARYLPSNYSVLRAEGENVIIQGEDSAGWTLEDYVIPRLASGMIRAKETTYHGIVKAVCLNCGLVHTDPSSLEILNDAPPGPECPNCGVHDILWTLANGTRSITQDLDDEGTQWFSITLDVRG